MKKLIAILFATVYFVFTTFAVGSAFDGDNGYQTQASADEQNQSSTSDSVAEYLTGKTPKHLAASGKLKLPRALAGFPPFAKVAARQNVQQDLQTGTAPPLLPNTQLFLRYGVLRI